MTLHWFKPPRFAGKTIDEVRDLLAPAGVVEREFKSATVTYKLDPDDPSQLMKEIGDIIVRPTGRIEVWPFLGGTERDLRTLYGAAEVSFREKPSKATGWDFRRRSGSKGYWVTLISVPVDEDDPWHSVIAREQADAENRALVLKSKAQAVDADLVPGGVR